MSSEENEGLVNESTSGAEALETVQQPASPVERKRVQPRIWPIPIVVFMAFCLHMSTSIATLLLAMWLVNGTLSPEMLQDGAAIASVTKSRLGLTLTLIVPQTMMLLPVLVAAFFSPVPFAERLGLVRGTWPMKLWISSAIATPIVGLISSMLVGGLMGESESLKEMTNIFRDLGKSGFFIPLALMVGLTPGICEELLFRGYVQTRLVARMGAVFAILFTSVAFAAFHMDLVHSTAVIAIGIYLGWLSWASGSIFPAMIAHFVNNFLSVAAVVLLPESAIGAGPIKSEDMPDSALLAMSGIVMASLVAFVFTLHQARKHRLAIA